MNAAVSYNIKNAITGVAPLQTTNFHEVLFSRGRISPPANLEVATTVVARLDISWSDVCENGIGALTDMANIIVFNPAKDFFAVVADAAPRSVGTTYYLGATLVL